MNDTIIDLRTLPQWLFIGYATDNAARPQVFDFSSWVEEYGSGTLELNLQRPGDEVPYPVTLSIEGTTATWTPSSEDTKAKGQGMAQFVYTVGGTVAHTAILRVLIGGSLGAGEDAPNGFENWFQKMQVLAAAAADSADASAASADSAEESAETAAEILEDVGTAGAEQIQAIEDAGTDQITAVGEAGAAQVQAVEDKGEEVLESIPEDYSELSSDVSDLKSSINYGFDPNPTDAFDKTAITTNRFIYADTGTYGTRSTMFVTNFIPVSPGDVIQIPSLNSTTYGTNLCNSSKSRVTTYARDASHATFTIPDGIAYIQTTGTVAGVDSFYVYIITELDEKMRYLVSGMEKSIDANPYIVRTLKSSVEHINGFNHVAFPSMCYFAGSEILAYHCSKSHRTPVDPANWGGVQFDKRTPDGTITHVKFLTGSDFPGINGEIRDTMIQPTRDGNYMILATWTTYTVNSVDHHDNLLVCFDTSFNIVDYLITPDVNYIYWGNPLITPQGHLICAAYGTDGNGGVVIMRSAEVFNGGVSTLTMEEAATVAGTGMMATECCVGYYKDKLAVFIRRDTNKAIIKVTSNLEGIDGWGPAMSTNLNIHATKLLPFAKGDFLPFYGALYVNGQTRLPIFGFFDTVSGTVVSYGNYSPDIGTNYGAYAGIVPRGGDDFDAIYYKESTAGREDLTAETELFYRRFNARELLPKMTYLM